MPLFVNRTGGRLTRAGIARLIKRYATTAARNRPTLNGRRISPHTLRHTTAMHLLRAGVDLRVISAMLGHASMLTTHHYTRIDLEMKRKALEASGNKAIENVDKTPKWREPDLLEWLEGLSAQPDR